MKDRSSGVEFKGISRYWWIPVLTGVLAIALGCWTLWSPSVPLEVMAYVFAACMLVAGALNLVYSIFSVGPASNWGWAMALGFLELIAGGWLLAMPAPALTVTFIFVVGIWILVVAINSLCEAFMLSSHSRDWSVWLIFALLLTLVLAIVFLSGPVAGGIAVWLWLGLSLITFGVYRIILGLKIRKLNKMTDGVL